MWIDDLTENEREVLRVGEIEEEYDGYYGFSYEISVYNYATCPATDARGALASLVKKGILNHKRFKEDGSWWNYYQVIDENKVKDLREYFKEQYNG